MAVEISARGAARRTSVPEAPANHQFAARLPEGAAVRFHAVRVPKRNRLGAPRAGECFAAGVGGRSHLCGRQLGLHQPLCLAAALPGARARVPLPAGVDVHARRCVSRAATGGGGGERDGIGRLAAKGTAAAFPRSPAARARVRAARRRDAHELLQDREPGDQIRRASTGRLPPSTWARWYITQAVAYLTRPNEALQLVTVHLAKTLSLDATSRYVSVHIRRGDKGSEAALHPTEAYADVIRNISAERHIDRVLLASDDKNAYEELPALLPDRFRVDYIPHAAWAMPPGEGKAAAAVIVANKYASPAAATANAKTAKALGDDAPPFDEGQLLLAQAQPCRRLGRRGHVDIKLRAPRARPRCGAEADRVARLLRPRRQRAVPVPREREGAIRPAVRPAREDGARSLGVRPTRASTLLDTCVLDATSSSPSPSTAARRRGRRRACSAASRGRSTCGAPRRSRRP